MTRNFARVSFNRSPASRTSKSRCPSRCASAASGIKTMAEAKDAQSGADVMVVQWLRFGGGGFLQMIGIARADEWPDVCTRLRTVRDSIDESKLRIRRL